MGSLQEAPLLLHICCCSVAQSCLTATPWIAALQAPLSFTISWNLLKFISFQIHFTHFCIWVITLMGGGSLSRENWSETFSECDTFEVLRIGLFSSVFLFFLRKHGLCKSLWVDRSVETMHWKPHVAGSLEAHVYLMRCGKDELVQWRWLQSKIGKCSK